MEVKKNFNDSLESQNQTENLKKLISIKQVIGYNGSLELKNSLFVLNSKKDNSVQRIIYTGNSFFYIELF